MTSSPKTPLISGLFTATRGLRLLICTALLLGALPVLAQTNFASDSGAPAQIKKMKPAMWAADIRRPKRITDMDTYYAATSTNQTLIISTAPIRGKGGGVMDNFFPVTVTDNPSPQVQDNIVVDDFYGHTLTIVVDHLRKMPPISPEAKAKDAVQYYLFITPVETKDVAAQIGERLGPDDYMFIRNRFDPDKYLYH